MDSMRLLLFSIVLTLVVSFGQAKGEANKKALYFLDINPEGSSIVSLKISSEDGKLSSPKRTPTGGLGHLALAYFPPTVGGSVVTAGPDGVFGQDSVVVSGNYLFTVNQVSHTLSLFLIDEENPTCITLLGQPADTLGEFPMAVAYSSKLKIACVLNGGQLNGVTCFSVDSVTGLTVLDKSPRPIYLNNTTPPIGVANTASDIVFNPSSTALFAITKGNPLPFLPLSNGYVFAWPVVSGKVSFEPASVLTLGPQGVSWPFSLQFTGKDDSKIYVSDALAGVAVFDVSPAPEFKITMKTLVVIPYNLAVCWSSYSPITDSLYWTFAAQPNVTIFDRKTETLSGEFSFPTSAPPATNFTMLNNASYGGYDNAIDKNFLYILGGEANVVVVDILKKTTIQNFDLSALGNGASWVGLALHL